MARDDLLQTATNPDASIAYEHYLEIRPRILDMLEEASGHADHPSDYWEEELAGFDYMLDASPLIIRKLREHCYHLTGLRSYDYRRHHSHRQEPYAKKLQALREQDGDSLLVPESPLLGGFGYEIDGVLINLDTLKFYESLIALNKAGILAQFRGNAGERKVVVEIGAGRGGFAYQFKTLFPNTCYIIVDLPQTLLFSAIYLKTAFPQASTLLYGDKPTDELLDGYASCDFVLLPHFLAEQMRLSKVDLAINMVSFQEMTSAQVGAYVRKLAELRCPALYSHNRDRSSHNTQLSAVSSIIGQYYDLTEYTVLGVPYTNLPESGVSAAKKINPIKIARTVAAKLLGRRSVKGYRHLVGTLKSQ